MTFEVHPDADLYKEDTTERLHEFLLNQRGYRTEDVLIVAHGDGRITAEIEDEVAV